MCIYSLKFTEVEVNSGGYLPSRLGEVIFIDIDIYFNIYLRTSEQHTLLQGIFSSWNKEKLCSPGTTKIFMPRASIVSPYSKRKIFPGVMCAAH